MSRLDEIRAQMKACCHDLSGKPFAQCAACANLAYLLSRLAAAERVVEAAKQVCDRYGPTHDANSNQWLNALDITVTAYQDAA